MTPRRKKTSPVLTEQVLGDALGEILRAGGSNALPELRPVLRTVDVNQIVAGSELQTRAAFDPEGDSEDAALVESVREVGVRQPVHLVDQADSTYRIRSGHRRVSAARVAERVKVPAIVWPVGTDIFDSALDTWLENLHRKDLSPLERGRMLAQLLERFELPRSPESAHKLGLSKTSFYRYLGLLEAPGDVQEALTAGHLGVVQAEKLAAVDDQHLRGRLVEAASRGIGASKIQKALQRHKTGDPVSEDDLSVGSLPDLGPVSQRRRKNERSWASHKSSELARALGLKAASLETVKKGLNARQISAAQATAAALLITTGDAAEDAMEAVRPLDRHILGALERLFRAVFTAPSGTRNPNAIHALRRILALIVARLEEEVDRG